MRLLPLLFLIPLALSADTIVDGVTITETTYQPIGTGGEVLVNFSGPVSSFDLDVFAYQTFDKRVCVEFGGTNTCLQGILASDPLNTPQPANTTNTDFYFSLSTATPSDIGSVNYSAQAPGDEFYPPQVPYKSFLTFSNLTTAADSVQTPEPSTFVLGAGALIALFGTARILCDANASV